METCPYRPPTRRSKAKNAQVLTYFNGVKYIFKLIICIFAEISDVNIRKSLDDDCGEVDSFCQILFNSLIP